jgi:hypothetical protein
MSVLNQSIGSDLGKAGDLLAADAACYFRISQRKTRLKTLV